MTDTHETLREAVRAAMKYVVVVLDDGACVMERPHCITQIGRTYDFVWEANQAAETLNIDAAIATMFERLRTSSLRCEPANGATLEEMRENLSAELKDAGDCKLVWVNEGDLAMLSLTASRRRTTSDRH